MDWMVDLGASFHATPKRDFFASYKSGNYGVVRMGNKETSPIVGVGDIHVEINLSYKLVLKNVRHVPDLCLNLIAPEKLDDNDYINFLGDGWKLTKDSVFVARGKKYCTLYKTQVKLCMDEVNTMEANYGIVAPTVRPCERERPTSYCKG